MKDLQKPGADIDSDHNMLVAKICLRLREILQFPNRDLEKLYAQQERVQDTWEKQTRCNGI